ncbi:hypothetical protein BH18ACT12_BH18ACT12_01350 [soil metagenome]
MKVRPEARSTRPRAGEARPPDLNGRSRRGGSEPVTEALDHLLEPLDLLQQDLESRPEPGWDVPLAGDRTGDGLIGALTRFRIRLRWSQRPRYRIPRLVIAWTFLSLVVVGVIWLMFEVTGPR